MANPATLLREARPGVTLSYFGPATVVSSQAGRATMRLEDEREVQALLALPLRYRPVEGDSLLVLGTDRFYAIAVVEGRGDTSLEVQGDLSLRAIDGQVDVTGDRGVMLRGPAVEVLADKWRLVADLAVTKVGDLAQRVRGLWSVHAASSQTAVDGEAVTKAKNATVLTEETMTINGKRIHLG